jgi:F0F1-type ATP synthase assembly protein I
MGSSALIIGAIVCSVIGYFVGKPKNRAVEGALWGFFLGLIGIVIIVLRKPAQPKPSF